MAAKPDQPRHLDGRWLNYECRHLTHANVVPVVKPEADNGDPPIKDDRADGAKN